MGERYTYHPLAAGGRRETIHLDIMDEGRRQFDSLPIAQTEHLIVINHSAHVLDPSSVDRHIQANPLLLSDVSATWCGNACDCTVSPLVYENICAAEKFIHSHRYRIKTLLLTTLW